MDGLINADNDFIESKLIDISKDETEEQIEEALSEGSLSLYPSSNPARYVQIESLLDLSVAKNYQKELEPSESTGFLNTMKNINLEKEKQRNTGLINKAKTPNFGQENQEIGREKLARGNSKQNNQLRPHMEILMRALPPKVKSSKKLEKEQEKAPKFKARPLNKTILESKGELGLFCNKKRQVTIPQEFHFALDGRIPAPKTINNTEVIIDKVCEKEQLQIKFCLKSHSKKLIPRNTIPCPFHFRTEERGTRIPKPNPYP